MIINLGNKSTLLDTGSKFARKHWNKQKKYLYSIIQHNFSKFFT